MSARKQSRGELNLDNLKEYAHSHNIELKTADSRPGKIGNRDRGGKEKANDEALGTGGSLFEYVMLDSVAMLLFKIEFWLKPIDALKKLKAIITAKQICDERYFDDWLKVLVEGTTAAVRWSHA